MKVMHSAFAALAFAALAGTAQAQRFGAQVSYGTDSDLGVGARFEAGMSKVFTSGPMTKAMFVGSFDYFFIDCPSGASCTYWEINPGLVVPVGTSSLKPYVGAGLNIAHAAVEVSGITGSNSETGINLIGGIRFPIGKMDGYSEARVSLGGGEQLVISFGVLFGKAKP